MAVWMHFFINFKTIKMRILFIVLVLLFTSCDTEPVNNTGKLGNANLNLPPIAIQATITNYNTGLDVWEGYYIDWLKNRLYKDGETYIIVLESWNHEEYYGKFIKTFHD